MYSKCPESLPPSGKIGHEPVLKDEALRLFAPKNGEKYIDCTFGGGGHSRAILQSADCSLLAFDRDQDAAQRAKKFAEEFPQRFQFIGEPFSKLNELKTSGYAGVLMDLGVSSFQLDEAERGFSLKSEGPLDMRMDTSKGITAIELIRQTPLKELEEILRGYGEEPRYKKAARAIKDAEGSLNTTLDLANLIEKTLGRNPRSKIHPATLTFQALRIAVNGELLEIEKALPAAFELLAPNGVLAVISFHSLEDRIVKKFFKKMAGLPEDRFDSSFVQDRVKRAELLTRKPICASDAEISRNPRSRSAKLRAIRKL
ncbi:MAG: 16S rRNA (cytosine(1402)-N(4))-methyltransferase RsmH [Opitutales bacterium]|nr:16S rRNA (cytosine(1402)-N(4))-methyltransferase RsmH [Opitutales bacterium]